MMRVILPRVAALALGICLVPAPAFSAPAEITGGKFASVIPLTEDKAPVAVESFLIDRTPVTNRDYLAFVVKDPDWRRGETVPLFVDDNYLQYWQGALRIDESMAEQPVVNVSWFAARAYCEAEGGRLPTWHEWEYAAAADEHERDARGNADWRQKILGWYSETGGEALPDVGRHPANAWGVQDMHGLVWEWVEDFNALLVSGDNREQGGADKLQFCGAGAVTMEEKENYAILMRTAMLSSLAGRDTTRNMGFRCAYDLPTEATQ